MIPEFVIVNNSPWAILPPGVYEASAEQVYERFAHNKIRKRLFSGLERGMRELKGAGCRQIFLDGSYVTGKPDPKDYDLCWDARNVNPALLDPIIWMPQFLAPPRQEQQDKYYGDYFQAGLVEGHSGKTFLDFFQNDRHSGEAKGIVNIKL